VVTLMYDTTTPGVGMVSNAWLFSQQKQQCFCWSCEMTFQKI
jgi:hypothetical protein